MTLIEIFLPDGPISTSSRRMPKLFRVVEVADDANGLETIQRSTDAIRDSDI